MDKELISNGIYNVLALEQFGVHIEDTNTKEDFVVKYYFSIPEFSTYELTIQDEEDKKLNDQIKTSDGLIALAKETFLELIINSCIAEFGEDEEFINEIKSNPSEYCKFFVKIRKGETWTNELGKKAVDKFLKEFKEAMENSYKEV